jgi:hypothetical protein
VFVNGFQQLPAFVKPDSTFTAELLLSREQNTVAVAVRQQDGGHRLEFPVLSAKPAKSQRMHLLTLSIRQREGATLEDQVRRTFECGPDKQGELQAPAFEKVYPYGPLVGYKVRREFLNHQLYIITTRIRQLARAGSFGNDVVMLYYQGGEAMDKDGHFFQTSLSQDGAELRSTAIACQELVSFFAETPGAHVLLLDVDRPGAQPTADMKDKDLVGKWQYMPEVKDHVVALRYAWLGQPDVPKDARLISALEKAMPQTRLADVMERTRLYADNFRLTYPNLVENEFAPEDLKQLVVGRTRGE